LVTFTSCHPFCWHSLGGHPLTFRWRGIVQLLKVVHPQRGLFVYCRDSRSCGTAYCHSRRVRRRGCLLSRAKPVPKCCECLFIFCCVGGNVPGRNRQVRSSHVRDKACIWSEMSQRKELLGGVHLALGYTECSTSYKPAMLPVAKAEEV
jgi:hypothetical protein